MVYEEFYRRQLEVWELARRNYCGLQGAENRVFQFDGFGVTVQFNPARIVSTGAKTDAKSVAERPCFLCRANRPAEQQAVDFGQFELLVNPFPIFPPHYVIAHKKHTPQRIEPYIGDMLAFARQMEGFALFYNGPRCGASAPDHHHFQACTARSLPIVGDYFRLRSNRTELLVKQADVEIHTVRNYLRTVVCIEAKSAGSGAAALKETIDILRKLQPTDDEPMMNMVAIWADSQYYIWVFPRKAFRPWQYSAEGEAQLLISPATVEMAGIVITPLAEHFNKVTANDIRDIYAQCSMTEAADAIRQIQ